MEEQKKLRLLRLLAYMMAVLMIVFAFNYEHFIPNQVAAEETPTCGVVDDNPKVEDILAFKEGRKRFKILCASCHKLDKEFIGPALRGITERRELSYVRAYITNSDSLIRTNPQFFKDTLNSTSHLFNQLTKEDVDNILEYTRMEVPILKK